MIKSALSVVLSVAALASPALAETSIECKGAQASLVLPDRGRPEFRVKLGLEYRVARIREAKPNSAGHNTAVQVTIDTGTSIYRMYEFAELNKCEDNTRLNIYEIAPVGSPRLLRSVTCTCAES